MSQTAISLLEKHIRPGDIINTVPTITWWKVWEHIIKWGIQSHQKVLFGPESNYFDTHTMMYFEHNRIFSVTAPKTKWESLDDIVGRKFTIYRFTKYDFSDDDLAAMYVDANAMIDIDYDYGQLLDIAISQILGYPHIIKYKWFDLAKKRMVCSVGARTLIENLRYRLEEQNGIEPFRRLFDGLNPKYWSPDQIAEFTRVDVEATSPAHFSNSHYFDFEFIKILNYLECTK